MANLPIDLDLDAVQYDGIWYTRDELAKKIKSQLDSGDYAVTRPSQALEFLIAALQHTATMTLKITQEQSEALAALAARQNRSPSAILRDALNVALGGARDVVGRRPTEPEMPAVAAPAPAAAPVVSAPPPMPPPMPVSVVPPGLAPSPSVIAGPGALKNSGAEAKVIIDSSVSAEEAASAVDLKPKKKDDAEAVERRWFGG